MSFLRGLMNKDKDKGKGKGPDLNKEEAAKPDPNAVRKNPIALDDAADFVEKKRMKVPTEEQKRFFAADFVEKKRMKVPTEEQKRFFDAARVKQRRIGSILVNHGLINEEMLQQSLRDLENEADTTLQRSLVEHQFVREEDVLDALAAELGMERVSLQDVEVTPELLNCVPKKVAKEYRVFPVSATDMEVAIAIADPLNIQVIDDLQRILGKPVRSMIASEEDIDRFFTRYYESDDIKKTYDEMTDEMINREIETNEQEIELEEDENAPPVVRFVDLIFKQAVHERASDIHIEPTRFGITVRYRVDGVLHEVPSPPKKWQNAILSRLKVLSGMDLAEKRVPQDGRIKLLLPDRKLDLRVNSLPSIYGETIVMRILDQSSVLLGLEDVGFLPDNITLFNSLIRSPTGVILMTGPTGSGKTTTHLVVVEDLSYEMAASILHVPVGTIMSRLSRARAALRRAIEGRPPSLRVVEGKNG